MAQELAQMQTFMSGEKQQTRLPYYTLSGLLLEDRAKSGNTNQVTYTFQMSLTTTSDGIAVWESEKQITKIGKKSTVGW
jgi:PBP1b-binding outer membrane lipoprotein LpoB